MKLINTACNFEIDYNEIYSSTKLTTANQKLLLLILLSNHKKYNTKHYSFTLTEELCKTLNISSPTFRKERNAIESLGLFTVKVKKNDKMVVAETKDRRHLNLYYYPNWERLSSLGFIKSARGFKDNLDLGTEITFKNMNLLNPDHHYNVVYTKLDKDGEKTTSLRKEVRLGSAIKGNLTIQNHELTNYQVPRNFTITYLGVLS
jgi:hypothetical protein